MTAYREMPSKDPAAVLDYKIDLAPLTNGTDGAKSNWLADGETISTQTISIVAHADTPEDPVTLVEDSSSITDSGTTVTAWLSGGTSGVKYLVSSVYETSAGRTDKRTIIVPVEDR